MSKTKEITELVKKLQELGYRKTIEYDVQYIIDGVDKVYRWSHRSQKVDYPGVFPIPSLEDGLEWLENYGFYYYEFTRKLGEGWAFRTELPQEYIEKTKHEAVLKAMIKVLETTE